MIRNTARAATKVNDGPSADAAKRLARRIRALREQRGWTLEITSERTGVSRSALSKIERHEMSPTFNAMHKLASGFGIGMAQLLDGGEQEERKAILVTRHDEGVRHATSHYQLRLLRSDPTTGSGLLAVEFTIDAPDIEYFNNWDRHDDENVVYILQGPVLFYSENLDNPVLLEAGDSVWFDARIGHAFVSASSAPGRAFSVAVRI